MSPSVRVATLDRLRGIAIALMILDHALVAVQTLGYDPGWVLLVRLTVTRVAMPLFMLISGALWVRHLPRPRRVASALAVGAVVEVTLAAVWPQFGLPEILLLWAGAACLARVVVSHPIPALILGYTQWAYWPVHWDGYQPGVVVVFLAAGVLWGRGSGLDEQTWSRHVPSIFETVGRHPLVWYVAHLGVLISLVATGVQL